MFKATTRVVSATPLIRAIPRTRAARRYLSTAPPHQKSRTWRSSAARWGLAGALVYYYNTASAFAEEPSYAVPSPPETSRESETYRTVASISEERRAQARAQSSEASDRTQSATVSTVADGEAPAAGSPGALEEEASEQGAFNEETGEINWDCPCLGGMAHGPCGEQFRAAFSCFVFSQEEPKGVDCIEHFKTMQNCFRDHPDIYGAELDDEEEGTTEAIEGETAPVPSEPAPQPAAAKIESTPPPPSDESSQMPLADVKTPSSAVSAKVEQSEVSTAKGDDNEELIPKASYDARDSTPAK